MSESEIVRRRRLWYAAALGGAIWLARVSVFPAPLRGLRLARLNGTEPTYAVVSWSYGIGARPASVIIDVEAGPASGSATTDGEAIEAEIPLGSSPERPYRVTASATYRIFGFARTLVTVAER